MPAYLKYQIAPENENYDDPDGWLDAYTPEYRRRWKDVVAAAPRLDFDCNDIARSLDDGLTLAETVARLSRQEAERIDAPPPYDPLDHDYSMNG